MEEELQMATYIGVKMIEAAPMTRGAYNEFKGWTPPEGEDQSVEGYLVKYPDGYTSWSPKDQFESAYFVLEGDITKPSPTITLGDVQRFITGTSLTKVTDKAATGVVGTLSGFDIYETSACVCPENYDEDIARSICEKRATDKVWGHLGFLLQWALNGIKGND